MLSWHTSCEKNRVFPRSYRTKRHAVKKESNHGKKGESCSAWLSNGDTLLDHQGCSECDRLLQTGIQGEGIDVFIRTQRQGRTRRNQNRRFSNHARRRVPRDGITWTSIVRRITGEHSSLRGRLR